MKYFVIRILTTGETVTKAVYEFDNEKDATASVHSEYAKFLKDAGTTQILCMMINSTGGVVEKLLWNEGI